MMMNQMPDYITSVAPTEEGGAGVMPESLPQRIAAMPAAAPAPEAMPQKSDFAPMYQTALAEATARYNPEAMAQRKAQIEADLAARQAAAMQEQKDLDRQRKWVGLMGLGAALQGGDPTRVVNPFTERRDAVSKRLQDIETMRTNLPQTLADERLKGLMGLGDAFYSYQRAEKAGQPEPANPLASQWMADSVAAAVELYPDVPVEQLAQRPDILLSPPVRQRLNQMMAARSGAVTEATTRARVKVNPPRSGGGGGGSGGKAGKPNVSGMSAGDLLSKAGL